MRVDNPGSAPCDVQTFTEPGEWVKPSGATTVTIFLIGCGGGGSAGLSGVPGAYVPGGPGGSGAGWVFVTVPASTVPDVVPIGVSPLGGAGGIGRAFRPTGGDNGANTTFGDLYRAAGGLGAALGGHGAVAVGSMIDPSSGGNPGTAAAGLGETPPLTGGGCPGGGGGGSVTEDGQTHIGGSGQSSPVVGIQTMAVSGEGDGDPGADGADCEAAPGQAGAGGHSSTSTSGGPGGKGGKYGAGGAGGGATTADGLGGGNGGDGGPGIAIIISNF